MEIPKSIHDKVVVSDGRQLDCYMTVFSLMMQGLSPTEATYIAIELERHTMRRIERLDDGRLYVGEGQGGKPANQLQSQNIKSFYVQSIDDHRVSTRVRKNFNTLTAVDIGTSIDKVGRRVSENIFWVRE